jgi:predicted nucleic acid-binding protein
VDANVAIKWVVDEPDSGLARSLATATLEAPDLLPIECASVLWK